MGFVFFRRSKKKRKFKNKKKLRFDFKRIRRKTKAKRKKQNRFLRKFNLLKRPVKRNPFTQETTPKIRKRVEKIKKKSKLAKTRKKEKQKILRKVNN